MKKPFIIVGLMLIALISLSLTACGDDDGSSGSVNYTSDEIIEMLTGKWEVYGHAKVTSSDTQICENLDGDYTGTVEFTKEQRAKAKSSVIGEESVSMDGQTYTEKVTLADFISDYYKYKITRKNGAVYITFGSDEYPYNYKIVSLTKTSFKLVCDDIHHFKYIGIGGKEVSVDFHYEITIISQ